MTIKDVPASPAYLVCHDHYDNGAMDVRPMPDLETAKSKAFDYNRRMDEQGNEGCHWAAYTKLPRKRVWKYRAPTPEAHA